MEVGQTVDLIGEKKMGIEQDLNEKIMGEKNRRLVQQVAYANKCESHFLRHLIIFDCTSIFQLLHFILI